MSLSGAVVKVGGTKGKLYGCQEEKEKVKTVIMPLENERDLVFLPAALRSGLNFLGVKNMNEVIQNSVVGRSPLVKCWRVTPCPD